MYESYIKLLFGLLLWMADLRDASGSGKLSLCGETTKEDILCSLVEDYNRVKVPQVPTEYFSEFSLKGVQEINEEKHTVTFMVDYAMNWEDKRLALSNSTGDGATQLEINHHRHHIWIPELYFPNSISLRKLEAFNGKNYWTLFYVKKGDKFFVYQSDILVVTIECKMRFADFPFDQQFCEWAFRPYIYQIGELVLKAPVLFSRTEGYTYDLVPANESLKFSSSGLAYDVEVLTPQSTTVRLYTLDPAFTYSLVTMKMKLKRNSREFNKLIIAYYMPTGSFAILSAFSFFIKPEIVPGRMGMLVTVFLVVTAIYGSVQAPSLRGFSYIELWYIGVQIPIIFALIEYGITLAILKFNGTTAQLKYFAEGTTTREAFIKVDLISFCLSFTFIVIYNCSYVIYVSNSCVLEW